MERSVLGTESMVKGFLSGSLVAGGLTFYFGWIFQLLFLILAIMVFLDTSCVYQKQKHIMTYLFFSFVGVVLGLIFMVTGMMFWYMILVIALMFGLYARGLLFRKHRKERPRHGWVE